ncbi:MAG: ribokinase [Maritimibacter sp.]
MAVFNFGSINVDHFYRVDHLPEPGETLVARDHDTGLGGKGANQSVAIAKAGVDVFHIGTVGRDGDGIVSELADFGVDTRHIGRADTVTAHANICVDDRGENQIVVFSGANQSQTQTAMMQGLQSARPGDFLVLQNEVNMSLEAAEMGKQKGMRIVYSAAPFDAEKTKSMMGLVDILVMNEVEQSQLSEHLGSARMAQIPCDLIVTRGARGASFIAADGAVIDQEAFEVEAVDTTGAGDCFIGYVVAGLAQGKSIGEALVLGTAASALQVQHPGTAKAIPGKEDVQAFIAKVT